MTHQHNNSMTHQHNKRLIRSFFVNYSDEKLASLLAHAQSNKLAWHSCCCFVGVATATHPLKGRLSVHRHLEDARQLPYGHLADSAYFFLAGTDEKRRRILIPMIKAEMKRREAIRKKEELKAEFQEIVKVLAFSPEFAVEFAV